jgi:3-methyladenine DNA glycosylase AlkD
VRDGMTRYAIPNESALGVRMSDIQKLARKLGRDPGLARALWKTGVYEARMLCAYIDDPAQVTPARMNAQARDFDNWAVCDTLCFALWVRSPHAFAQITKWATSREEFVKRAAFALLASVALRDRSTPDAAFMKALKLVEQAADDERNFVKKGVNWALRGIGGRNLALNVAAVKLARKLAAREQAAPRWIGKDALRQLASPAARKRLERTVEMAKAAEAAKAAKAAKSARTR